jgi:hypothetical protein
MMISTTARAVAGSGTGVGLGTGEELAVDAGLAVGAGVVVGEAVRVSVAVDVGDGVVVGGVVTVAGGVLLRMRVNCEAGLVAMFECGVVVWTASVVVCKVQPASKRLAASRRPAANW